MKNLFRQIKEILEEQPPHELAKPEYVTTPSDCHIISGKYTIQSW